MNRIENVIIIDTDEIHNFIIDLCVKRKNNRAAITILKNSQQLPSILSERTDFPLVLFSLDIDKRNEDSLKLIVAGWKKKKFFPVILYLNHPEKIKQLCLELGLPLWLPKPFTSSILQIILSEYVQAKYQKASYEPAIKVLHHT